MPLAPDSLTPPPRRPDLDEVGASRCLRPPRAARSVRAGVEVMGLIGAVDAVADVRASAAESR